MKIEYAINCELTPTVVLIVGVFHFCRAYMSVKELKEELQLSSADTLNVFFASNSVREELAGAATWPWAKEALTHQGKIADFKLNVNRQLSSFNIILHLS